MHESDPVKKVLAAIERGESVGLSVPVSHPSQAKEGALNGTCIVGAFSRGILVYPQENEDPPLVGFGSCGWEREEPPTIHAPSSSLNRAQRRAAAKRARKQGKTPPVKRALPLCPPRGTR